MKVLINGIGNIGTTLACLVFDFKKTLNITDIIVFKNIPQPWRVTDLEILEQKGIKVLTSKIVAYSELIKEVDYIFEATANGIALQNKLLYKSTTNLKGICAQGSEKSFGIPFMSGLNNNLIKNKKFVQIVSCNTHGAASILQTLCGKDLSNLKQSDFVVVRRSEDIGNHQRLVTANVVARHLSSEIGTHHAIDVADMFNTLNVKCNITSSDITTPSQLMHSTRFSITFNSKMDLKKCTKLIENNLFLSSTTKFDSNFVFEIGRRYGKYGRLYNHAIILTNNLLLIDNTIKGWAFVPQEGNSLISTLHAFLLQTQPKLAIKSIQKIKSELLFDKL